MACILLTPIKGASKPIADPTDKTNKPTYDNLPIAPRPKKPRGAITLYYDKAQWSSQLQGRKIRLKVKIDAFGKIRDYELIMSCGVEDIDNAAIESLEHIEFDPGEIDITLFNTWFLLVIPVRKPSRIPFWEETGF